MSTPITVFAIWGDSEAVAFNDWPADYFRGWAERALAGNYPYVNVSRHASHVSQVVTSPAAGTSGTALFAVADYRQRWRIVRLANCSHVLSAYGVNDLGSDTVAVTQANLLAHWTELVSRGMKVWQYTLPPLINTSTDNWTTVAGQTASASNSKRVSLNAWIRAGAPIDPASKAAVAVGTGGALVAGGTGHPLKGYLETSDSWESTRDSGLWKAPTRSITDAAMTSSSVTLTSATAAFTQADVGALAVIVGAGTSGGRLVANIQTVTNATTATLQTAASTSVSGATGYLGVATADGQHPSKTGHVAAATAISAQIATIAAS